MYTIELMESKEENQELDINKKERLEAKLNIRKKNLEQLLFDKRISQSNQKDQPPKKEELDLVKEDNINKEKNKIKEIKDIISNNNNNLELPKAKSDLFLTKKKRLFELNNLSLSKNFNSLDLTKNKLNK